TVCRRRPDSHRETPGMTPPTTSGPPPKVATVNFGTVIRAVRRYAVLFSLFGIAAAGIGAAVYIFLPLPKLTRTTILYIQSPPEVLLNGAPDAKTDFTIYRQTQAALIKSRVVLANALSDPAVSGLPMLDPVKVQGDAVSWLITNMKVDFTIGPEYM